MADTVQLELTVRGGHEKTIPMLLIEFAGAANLDEVRIAILRYLKEFNGNSERRSQFPVFNEKDLKIIDGAIHLNFDEGIAADSEYITFIGHLIRKFDEDGFDYTRIQIGEFEAHEILDNDINELARASSKIIEVRRLYN